MSATGVFTIVLGAVLGPAPRGRVAAPVPLRWPNKNAGDAWKYAVDPTQLMAAGDSVTAASVAITPAYAGGLQAGEPIINGNVVTFSMSAGIAGEDYGVTVTIVLASGEVLQPICGLYVMAPQYPQAAPA